MHTLGLPLNMLLSWTPGRARELWGPAGRGESHRVAHSVKVIGGFTAAASLTLSSQKSAELADEQFTLGHMELGNVQCEIPFASVHSFNWTEQLPPVYYISSLCSATLYQNTECMKVDLATKMYFLLSSYPPAIKT